MRKLLALLLIALPVTTFANVANDITVAEEKDFTVDLSSLATIKNKPQAICKSAKEITLTNIDGKTVTLMAINFEVDNSRSTKDIIPYFCDFGITVGDNMVRSMSSNLFTVIKSGETGEFTFYYELEKVPSTIEVKTTSSKVKLDVTK